MAYNFQEIKQQINIVDVVRNVAPNLQDRGAGRFATCCPLHNEKTPSFYVDENNQFFKCFGCNRGGDVYRFYQEYYGLSFLESVQALANENGISLDKYNTKDNNSSENVDFAYRKRLLECMNIAFDYYKEQYDKLPDSHEAKQEIVSRGLSVDSYEYGFSPKNNKNPIDKFLSSKGFTVDEMLEIGVVKQYDNSVVDRFYGRLVFPFKDNRNNVYGLNGRTVYNSKTKYTNTPNSKVFNKSNAIFNLNNASKAIRYRREVFVCEGQFDVISMINNGFDNTVCLSGTGCTFNHVNSLHRLVGENGSIVFCLDGDEAGLLAMVRVGKVAPQFVNSFYVVVLPNGQDPCSLLSDSQGRAEFASLVDARASYCEFVVKYWEEKLASDGVCVQSARGRKSLLYSIGSFVSKVENTNFVESVKEFLQKQYHYTPTEIYNAFDKNSAKVFSQKHSNSKKQEKLIQMLQSDADKTLYSELCMYAFVRLFGVNYCRNFFEVNSNVLNPKYEKLRKRICENALSETNGLDCLLVEIGLCSTMSTEEIHEQIRFILSRLQKSKQIDEKIIGLQKSVGNK